MFSQIPLPQQMSQMPGGGILAAQNGLYQNQIAKAQAQYAPYNQYSTAALNMAQANMLPYQIQAQQYSNPLLMQAMSQLAKTDPTAYKNYMIGLQNFGRNIPQGNAIFGNMPVPGQPQNGLFSALVNKLTGNSSNNAMNQPGYGQSGNALLSNPSLSGSGGQNTNTTAQNQSPNTNDSNGTPLVPASQDNAIIGTATAQYNKTPYKPGDLIWDAQNNKVISNASDSLIQQAQQGLSGLQRIDPLIRRLGIEQFPDQSGWTSLLGDIEAKQNRWGARALDQFLPQFENQYPDIAKQFNLKGLALPTLRARAESDKATAPEQLIRIYGLKPGKYTIQELSSILNPGEGETGNQYIQRLMEKITQMQQEEGAPYKQQLKQGFDLTNTNQKNDSVNQASSANSQKSKVSNNVTSNVSPASFDAAKFLDQNWVNADEFKQAFNSYDDKTKKLITDEMTRRGWK